MGMEDVKKIQDLLNVLSVLKDGEDEFSIWPPCQYYDLPMLTLKSKYGFRRFSVPFDMSIEEAKRKAKDIDAAMCQVPRREDCKKYIGLDLIPL